MAGRLYCAIYRNFSHLRRPIIKNEVMASCFLTQRSCSTIDNNQTTTNEGNNSVITASITELNSSPLEGSIPISLIDDDGPYLQNLTKEQLKIPNALDYSSEDVSYVAPALKPTFNFAAYANRSPTIQELVKLGVELWRLETDVKAFKCILQHDFEEMKPYIQFLHDCGVPADNIGSTITKAPLIFNENLDDLRTRIRYLRAHNFNKNDIARIVTHYPKWILIKTVSVDRKMGFFQTEFKLSGRDVRSLVVHQPRVISVPLISLMELSFALKEEMGFEESERKSLILTIPNFFLQRRERTVTSFDYAHNKMKLSHEILSRLPKILLVRAEILKNRHEYLESLNRVQYDPEKPLYISPDAVAMGTDYDFCSNVAKTSIELYNMFLKSR